MRILILNWRCPSNPRAGGAEIFTFEVARRLVQRGDSVEWFSASYPKARSCEAMDGVRIVRAGHQWTVHIEAFRHYRGSLRPRFDVVIDEVNTVPFFTPAWADIPRVMLIHQLAREVWWYESPFPVNSIGFVAESAYLRSYRREYVLTVSESTREDLLHLGFTGPISIVRTGIEPVSKPSPPKSVVPTFIYVGRLAPSKRIDDILRAFSSYRGRTGTGLLWLVGTGLERYQRVLQQFAKSLGIDGHVTFWGHVPTRDKHLLMGTAHALLMTSVREGWGLVVTEANACGTPAIVYDVPGLRDSVRHSVTGLVVPENPRAMSEAMIEITKDKELHSRLAIEATRWSQQFTFDGSAQSVRSALDSALDHMR